MNGYAQDVVARFCAERTKLLQTAPTVPLTTAQQLLASTLPDGARVLDFGGGAGIFAVILRRAFPNKISRYCVVETAHQVAAALAAGLGGVAEFSTEIPKQDFDVVLTSGVLQYLDEPIGALRKLAALKAPVLILARNVFSAVDLHIEQTVPLFAHGPGPVPSGFTDQNITHSVRTVKVGDAKDVLAEAGYSIRSTSPDESGLPIRHPALIGENWVCSR